MLPLDQQSRLPEEESLDLCQRVGMLLHETQRQTAGQPLEGVAVDAESQAARYRHVAHLFPTAPIELEPVVQTLRLGLQPLHGQRRNPVGQQHRVEIADVPGTRLAGRVGHQRFVIGPERGRTRQHQRGNLLTVGAVDRGIGHLDHMQHHRVVGRVEVMVVPTPVRSPPVNLHVTGPDVTVDTNLGIEKIGARVGIQPPHVDYPHLAAVDRRQSRRVEEPVLPHILHEFFHTSKLFACFSSFPSIPLPGKKGENDRDNSRKRCFYSPRRSPFSIFYYLCLCIYAN